MVGYAEYQETDQDGNLKRRRNVRPLDQVIPRFGTHAELAVHLITKASLPERKQTAWWWKTSSEESLKALKKLFEDVNQGLESTAMLPRRMTVFVPDYEETKHGKNALLSLGWSDIPNDAEEVAVVRALFEDITDWFRVPNPLGAGALHAEVYPARSTDRAGLLLRNM